jgi:hypothetical protein
LQRNFNRIGPRLSPSATLCLRGLPAKCNCRDEGIHRFDRHNFCTSHHIGPRRVSTRMKRPEPLQFRLWGPTFIGRASGWRGPTRGSSDATESGCGGTLSARSGAEPRNRIELAEGISPERHSQSRSTNRSLFLPFISEVPA